MVGDIRQHLGATPFEPFTIVTLSGRRYPVPSADHSNSNPQGTRVVVWFDDGASITIAGLHVAALKRGPVRVAEAAKPEGCIAAERSRAGKYAPTQSRQPTAGFRLGAFPAPLARRGCTRYA